MNNEFKKYNDAWANIFAQLMMKQMIREMASQPATNATQMHKEDIKALIDLALDTEDIEWFMELTEKYKALAV